MNREGQKRARQVREAREARQRAEQQQVSKTWQQFIDQRIRENLAFDHGTGARRGDRFWG